MFRIRECLGPARLINASSSANVSVNLSKGQEVGGGGGGVNGTNPQTCTISPQHKFEVIGVNKLKLHLEHKLYLGPLDSPLYIYFI